MRFKLLTLALVAGVLIAAVPALAQDDTSGYTSTTPTVTTPTTTTPPGSTSTEGSGVTPTTEGGETTPSGSEDEELAQTGAGDTWLLLAIGGVLALGSAFLLARERLPRRGR